jgi:dextranase
MSELTVWPTRAQIRPGEQLDLVVESVDRGPGSIQVLDGAERILEVEFPLGARNVLVDLPQTDRAGLAVKATDAAGFCATSAIDVAPHWSVAPRYAFFSDFGPDEPASASTERADALLRLHVNVVQFYDWMASHHTLVSDTDEFVDPLGRRLSHAIARRKVELAHDRGMAALGYGALYGAEADFALARPDWLLYDGRLQPLALADLFYLQDFSASSPWRDWIEGQFEDAVDRIGFDGIHIDQYGFPKSALSRATGSWRQLDVGAEFPGFVEEACRRILARRPDGGSIFNCVNAWPLDAMARVGSDAATYIEVWEPHSRYRDLYELVRRARTVRPDKAVILAAYLLPFSPDRPRSQGSLIAFRLASAAIGASGGFHLIAGEGNALLTEAYYPRYGRLDPAESAVVRSYADFAVRNTTRLHDHDATDIAWTHVGPTNDAITLEHSSLGWYGAGAVAGSVWVIGRQRGAATVLQLVNLRGLASDSWNVEQPTPPVPLEGVVLRVSITGGVRGIWWDTPDDGVGVARALPYETIETNEGRFLVARVPRIDVWTSVWWELDGPPRQPAS